MADWQLQSIFHFTVAASDFERSLEFYQTLGFRLLRDNRDVVWPDYVATQFGLKEAQGRGALLAVEDGDLHTRLDLIEWLAPTPEPASSRPIEERVPRIVALRTRGVLRAMANSDDLEFGKSVGHTVEFSPVRICASRARSLRTPVRFRRKSTRTIRQVNRR